MSTSDAERYGRRVRNAESIEELGDNTKRAIDQLVRAIKDPENRVRKLEGER
jgi:hypothetical protein